jgi:hypothetical protein
LTTIAPAVIKRLANRRVLQPHRGVRISFDPTPAAPGDSSSSASGSPPSAAAGGGGEQPHGSSSSSSSSSRRTTQSLTTDLLMLVAGNSRQMGRTVAVAPDALLDDGLLDFTLLTGESLASQVRCREVRGTAAGRRPACAARLLACRALSTATCAARANARVPA